MTHQPDTNADRLHVDVLLAEHYPHHDRSCPDHRFHREPRDDHHRHRDYRHHDHRDRHRFPKCRHDPVSLPVREPNGDEEGIDE